MADNNLTADLRICAPMRRHIRSLRLDTVEAYRIWCRRNGFNARLNKTLAQRQRELAIAQKTASQHRALSDLEDHMAALGLGSVGAYRTWCRKHNQGDGLHKSASQRLAERRLAKEVHDRLVASRVTTRQHKRRRKEILRLIAHDQIDERELTSPVLLRIHQIFKHTIGSSEAKSAFLSLLTGIKKNHRLFHLNPVVPQFGPRFENSHIHALAALVLHHECWIRPLDSWQPGSRNGRRQFGGLARHLLARYDVPECMDTAFFTGTKENSRRQQQWFIHVGGGQNIRKADIPIAFTKRMAHVFTTQAPSS